MLKARKVGGRYGLFFFAKWRKAWKRPVGGIVAGSINEKSSEKP